LGEFLILWNDDLTWTNTTLLILYRRVEKDKSLPDMDKLLQMRENADNYSLFYEHILPCIVGTVYWKKAIPGKLVSEVATPSDEALALLILENSWDAWNQEAACQTLQTREKENTK
jgi:hypothetical protein